MSSESIERVIERCRDRIDRSLDCNAGDILRLIEEIEKSKRDKPHTTPLWYGLGTGD